MSSERTPLRKRVELDAIDRRILAILQEDATTSIAEIASRVGLSQTPSWRRIQRLEREGVIRRRVTDLDPALVGLGQTVLVFVETARHSPEGLAQFAEAVRSMPEIVEAHRLAGDLDYLLKVMLPDLAAYDRFHARLIAAAPVKSVKAHPAIECLKDRGSLPLMGDGAATITP